MLISLMQFLDVPHWAHHYVRKRASTGQNPATSQHQQECKGPDRWQQPRSPRPSALCTAQHWLPAAAVANYHKLKARGRSSLMVLEGRIRNQGLSRAIRPPKALGEELSLLLPAPGAAGIWWLMAASPQSLPPPAHGLHLFLCLLLCRLVQGHWSLDLGTLAPGNPA